MMARVSLGHTGRMLEPAPLMTLAFVAVNLAALIRVALPLFFPTLYLQGIVASGLLWMWPHSACSPPSTRPSCCAHESTANPVK